MGISVGQLRTPYHCIFELIIAQNLFVNNVKEVTSVVILTDPRLF